MRGGLSRHKVAVGEPAAGSPPFLFSYGVAKPFFHNNYFHNGPVVQPKNAALALLEIIKVRQRSWVQNIFSEEECERPSGSIFIFIYGK